MADFLNAVKSARHKGNEPEDAFITAVKTTEGKSRKTPEDDETKKTSPKHATAAVVRASSPGAALQILRSQPSLESLVTVLSQLQSQAFKPDFEIHVPGPLQAQIINTLLNTTVPEFWPTFNDTETQGIIAIFTNVAGLNAIVARLRQLSGQQAHSRTDGSTTDAYQIQYLLQLVGRVLKSDLTLSQIWQNLQASASDHAKRDLAWKELVNLVGSGKIISTIAQAEDVVKGSATSCSNKLASGAEYSDWLGQNIAGLVELNQTAHSSTAISSVAASGVLAKGLNLAYPNRLLNGMFKKLLVSKDGAKSREPCVKAILERLPDHSKRIFLEHVLRWLSRLASTNTASALNQTPPSAQDVSALAPFIALVVSADTKYEKYLTTFLSDPALASMLSFQCQRACIAAISGSTAEADNLNTMLEKIMSSFNDQLFISHAPILQQESSAQRLLLTAGYLHRRKPMALLVTARSSNHMQGVSNRLDSTNTRARWLGMVVGTAISSLVDKEGSKMNFGTDDMETEEAEWYMSLVKTSDSVGHLRQFVKLLENQDRALQTPKKTGPPTKQATKTTINGKTVFGPARPPAQTEVIGDRVTELPDNESDEDEDDLKSYAKPDSDPEDSDEDATLVNRNKPRVPVYIRDLMSMLRDDQNHDRFQLGIRHAANLIRRKTNLGKEIKDHAEEIGVILCNLSDPFETEDFDQLRLQAMIAVLLSDVKFMAPWFSRQAFVGDYSIAQRCIILSALGLGGREMAGFKNEDELNPLQSSTGFPTKQLPAHLHSIYQPQSPSTRRLEAASQDMEQALIKTMALEAADRSTASLNAVKVRTFSSRMDVERTKRKPAANALAKVFGESFFFPLVNCYQQELTAYGSSSTFASVPTVLVTFIKTLALLFHASGPATFGINEITADFWDLLLSLRVKASAELSVLHAVLFSLLTTLELNPDGRRVLDEHPKRLMETQQWVDVVFERIGGGNIISENAHGEEEKIRTLAAGVLVKCKGIIDAYQKELVGFSVE